jgi:transcriptional regulator with XRE-family HTH domain
MDHVANCPRSDAERASDVSLAMAAALELVADVERIHGGRQCSPSVDCTPLGIERSPKNMDDTLSSTETQGRAPELDALPGRLAQALAFSGLSQAELSRRVEMSPSFISDVMRGVKRPGPELLLALRKSLGVSIDWLLTGEGTMAGGSGIRHELFQSIRVQVAVAKAAVLEDNPTAKALLSLIQEGSLGAGEGTDSFRRLLDSIAPVDVDLDLVVQLYNGHQWAPDPITQRRNLVAAAVAHFESRKPFDRLSALVGEPADVAPQQVISGKGHRIAAGNYIENRGRKK